MLGYERGGSTLASPAEYDGHLDGLAAGLKQNGLLDRADVREKLGRLVVENEVMRANGLRNLANIASGNAPGPESSIEKIFWSEYAKRLTDTALDLLGPQAQLQALAPERATRRGLGVRVSLDARRHDLFGLERDSAQHHREARPAHADEVEERAEDAIRTGR